MSRVKTLPSLALCVFVGLAVAEPYEAIAVSYPEVFEGRYLATGSPDDVGLVASGWGWGLHGTLYLYPHGEPHPDRIYTFPFPIRSFHDHFRAHLTSIDDPNDVVGLLWGKGFDTDGDGVFDQAALRYTIGGVTGTATVALVADPYEQYKCWPKDSNSDGCAPVIRNLTCNVNETAPDVVDFGARYDYRYANGLVGNWSAGILNGGNGSYFPMPGVDDVWLGTCDFEIEGDTDGSIQYHCTSLRLGPWDGLDFGVQTIVYDSSGMGSNQLYCPPP